MKLLSNICLGIAGGALMGLISPAALTAIFVTALVASVALRAAASLIDTLGAIAACSDGPVEERPPIPEDPARAAATDTTAPLQGRLVDMEI